MDNRGIALLVTLILLGTIIATALSISVLITGETKINRLVDDSVMAVYAADAGMEKMFYACSGKIGSPSPPFSFNSCPTLGYPTCFSNNAKYDVYMDPNKSCADIVVRSRGQFGATQRSFEAAY